MPSLELWHWEEYAPAIGNNKSLPPGERFTLRVKAGITKARFAKLLDDAKASTPEQWHEALRDLVEMGPAKLTVDGSPVDTLLDFLKLAEEQRNGELLKELLGAIVWHNSIQGARSFTYGPLSGGRAGTGSEPVTTPPADSSAEGAGTETRH